MLQTIVLCTSKSSKPLSIRINSPDETPFNQIPSTQNSWPETIECTMMMTEDDDNMVTENDRLLLDDVCVCVHDEKNRWWHRSSSGRHRGQAQLRCYGDSELDLAYYGGISSQSGPSMPRQLVPYAACVHHVGSNRTSTVSRGHTGMYRPFFFFGEPSPPPHPIQFYRDYTRGRHAHFVRGFCRWCNRAPNQVYKKRSFYSARR